MTSCLPARREEVGAPPPDRPLHHPRPGIYNAVLRSDRFGTGHRLGIQNAPAGGPSQITDHSVSRALRGGRGKEEPLSAIAKQRRATTTYRLPAPLGTPPLLNV